MFKKVVVRNQPASYSAKVGIRLLLVVFAMLTLSQTVGCKLGIKQAAMVTYRDTVWAKRAYNLRYGNCDREYSEHFQNGFCSGYSSICNGNEGYVPALPPEEYRSYEYQTADGARCVNSWFEGFPAGVAAAKKDKVGNYHDIMISRLIKSAVEQSNSEPVLPDDVPVVPTEKVSQASADMPFDELPSPQEYIPIDDMPSVLQQGTFDAPPQAQTAPASLPKIIQADYAIPSTTESNQPLSNSTAPNYWE